MQCDACTCTCTCACACACSLTVLGGYTREVKVPELVEAARLCVYYMHMHMHMCMYYGST